MHNSELVAEMKKLKEEIERNNSINQKISEELSVGNLIELNKLGCISDLDLKTSLMNIKSYAVVFPDSKQKTKTKVDNQLLK